MNEYIFNGPEYDPQYDNDRLKKQMGRVYNLRNFSNDSKILDKNKALLLHFKDMEPVSEDRRAPSDSDADEWASSEPCLMTWPEWCLMFDLRGSAILERVSLPPFLESI